ncbi:hypothetical protein M0R45_011192 [Rubus argutus]|uniref:Gamma-tubulin complex component n=1 Tax=Rubus argutus TaxID=59490 RepID=A0AAW1YA37_RUBAR
MLHELLVALVGYTGDLIIDEREHSNLLESTLPISDDLLSSSLPDISFIQPSESFFVLLPPLYELILEIERHDIRGGQLLNLLHKRCHCGVPELQTCIQRLLWHAHQDMLPEYIQMRVAESVLFAGKGHQGSSQSKPCLRFRMVVSHQPVPGDPRKNHPSFTKIFECAVDSIRAIAASHLWQLVVVRADLNGHLKALKDYFLLAKGDFFQCFLEESRQLMRLPPRQSTAEADLMVPFQLAALKTIGEEDKHFSRVSLRMPLFGMAVKSSLVDIPKTDGISGTGQSSAIQKYPLMVGMKMYPRYCRVFQYLLRLKRTQMELEKSWASVMHQDHTDFATHRNDRVKCSVSQQRRQRSRPMWRIREHMAFLIRNLQFYIQVDVIESQWNVLQAHIQESHDFNGLVAVHLEYLNALISQSFLDIGSLSRILDSIMKLCIRFCWNIENQESSANTSNWNI